MRTLHLLTVLSLFFVIAGCHTCKQQDDFGKCQECTKCARSVPNIKLSVPQDEAATQANIDTESLEKLDVIFSWEKIFQDVQNVRQLYVTRARDSQRWYTAYATCQVSNQAWEQYWQNMTQAAIKFYNVKEAMLKRLGHLYNQEGLRHEEREAIVNMIRHLRQSVDIQSEAWAKILGDVEKAGQLPMGIKKEAVNEAWNSCKQSGHIAEVDHIGSVEIGSEEVLNRLKSALQDLEKVPAKS